MSSIGQLAKAAIFQWGVISMGNSMGNSKQDTIQPKKCFLIANRFICWLMYNILDVALAKKL